MIKQLRSQNCFRYFHYGTVLEYYCSTNPETHCLHSFLTDSPTKQLENIVKTVSFQMLPEQ